MSYELLADEVLLRLLKKSDEKAFDAIFNRYWTRIFISAYKKTRSKEIAEDLAQNLFARLWDKRTSSNIDHLAKYLSVGIKNSVINIINGEMIKINFQHKLSRDENEEISADHSIILKDLQNAISQALAQLPEKTRNIFTLSRFEKYSVREIAEKFGITEKAVEYHITQSNKILRSCLKEYLVFEILVLARCIL